jgi:hypothetical protein
VSSFEAVSRIACDGLGTATDRPVDPTPPLIFAVMTTYLYLPGGFPAIVTEEDRWRYDRHPLIGVYT